MLFLPPPTGALTVIFVEAAYISLLRHWNEPFQCSYYVRQCTPPTQKQLSTSCSVVWLVHAVSEQQVYVLGDRPTVEPKYGAAS